MGDVIGTSLQSFCWHWNAMLCQEPLQHVVFGIQRFGFRLQACFIGAKAHDFGL